VDEAEYTAVRVALDLRVRYVVSRPPISRDALIDGLADQVGVLAGLGGGDRR